MSRPRDWSLRRLLTLVAMSSVGVGCQRDRVVPEEALREEAAFEWTRRDEVRAFYSGHSLSDGVPEAVARIASARGQTLEFEFQTASYSLLRERTKGESASSPTWDGYKTGGNRNGNGLDVVQELASPSRLSAGARYDALVVTERHDLPWTAAREDTATYLADFAKRAWLGNPRTDVFFYHTWLALDRSDPRPWIQYERRAQRLWECVASRANRDLGDPTNPVRVLPGGAALAELVELLWEGRVPGIVEASAAARVELLFVDDVHLSALGTYYMGLVHYAILFGQPPIGSVMPAISNETRAFLEKLADQAVTAYARVANAATRRDMEACRTFAANEMCGASYRLPARSWLDIPLRPFKARTCQRVYADADSPTNPFARALRP